MSHSCRPRLAWLFLAFLCAAWLPASAAPGTVEAINFVRFPGGNNESRRALVQADGKMVLVGTARWGTMQFSATRYNADGTLDNSFGTFGTLIEPVGPGDSEAWAGALQADGKLVMAGWSQPPLGTRRFAVARFNADGSFDTSFGGGAVTTMFGTFESEARAVVVQPDGKIVAGGWAMANSRRVFALARYNVDGSLDASFGTGGLYTRASGAVDQVIHALALQPDGKIVAAGDSGTDHVLLVRFTANGTPDPAWTGGGVLYFSNVRDIAIRGFDGKIYVVGTTVTGMVTGAPLKAGVGRFLPDGNVDNGYGASGVIEIDTPTASYGFGLVLQPDFKVTISGGVERAPGQYSVLVARLESNGLADTTFGTAGISTFAFTNDDRGYGLGQRSGGFIVAGRATSQGYDSLAVAVNGVGQLDTTFNFNESPGFDVLDVGSIQAPAFASVLQADGKLLVAGTIINEQQVGGFQAVVARFLPNDTLDTAFGTGGFTIYPGLASSIALAPDGRIVTAGNASGGISFARLLADGSLDPSFGTGGVSLIPGNGTGLENVLGIKVQPDGRIVAGGSSEVGAFSDLQALFMRLTVSGQLDPTFSGDGRAKIPLTSGRNWINAIALQADGKILAAGYSEAGSSGSSPPSFTLARVNTDGSLDTSFGSGGVTRTVIDGTTSEAMAMALQPDGRIVLAGRSYAVPTRNFALARYLPSGTLDTSFGSGGTVTSDFGNHDDAYALALLSNGQIVAAGQSGGQFGVARYFPSGALDTSFGSGGVATFVVNAGADIAKAVTVGLDGKLHVSGDGSKLFAVARLSNELATSADPNSADLALTQSASPNPVTAGSDVTFTLSAHNNGPATSTGVTITDTLPSGVTFVSASAGCSNASGQVTCNLGSLANGATAQVNVVVRTSGAGSITNNATITATQGDPVAANNASSASVTVNAQPVADPPRLGNISTRGQVRTGNDVMIGGFVIGGSDNKTVVIRARGPSLAAFGITNPLANPMLQLFRSSDQTQIAVNDDWGSAPNAAAISASGFAPSNSLESAILVSLPPGAYTAIVSGVGGGTGVGIVEIFEVDNFEAPLVNISTRGQVLTGNDVMIGGFVIQGASPQTVVVRARGPSLVPFGIANALANPTLQLVRSSDQSLVAANDDWGTAPNAAALSASGFAPSDSRESAILITLDPGAYTAIVSGVGGTTGVGIVEVFRQ